MRGSLFGSSQHAEPAAKDIRTPPRLQRIAARGPVGAEKQTPCLAPAVPSRAGGVITGSVVITACFLKRRRGGRGSLGSNPPVSAHINGLIGLFSPSQNAKALSLTEEKKKERLSPSEPLALKYRETHDVCAKWSPSPAFSPSPALRLFTLLSFLSSFFSSSSLFFCPHPSRCESSASRRKTKPPGLKAATALSAPRTYSNTPPDKGALRTINGVACK